MKYENLHPDELKQIVKKSGILYLPLGTLEWHEKHLPFGTDSFTAYDVCTKVCKKTGGCVVPPLWVGTDREHKIKGKTFHGMDAKAGKILPGSLYFLKGELFYKVLVSIAKSAAEQGFRKLVVISGHTGTAQIKAIRKLEKTKIKGLKIMCFEGYQFSGGIDHAGKAETQLMLAVNEKLVNMGKLKKPYKGILKSDPHDASKSEGKKRIKETVDLIAKKVR